MLAARVIDRLGKGIRDAPRDAFLADLTAKEIRGEGFGLRLALAIVGFVVGPLVAIGLMKLSGDDFRLVFWIALIPAYLRRILRSYSGYYNDIRTHRSLDKDAPVSRPVQRTGTISSRPVLGGLHHHYVRV